MFSSELGTLDALGMEMLLIGSGSHFQGISAAIELGAMNLLLFVYLPYHLEFLGRFIGQHLKLQYQSTANGESAIA
jgi:hypothetical protein